MNDFETFRKQYPEFIYEGYKISENDNEILLEYSFEITGCKEFNPSIRIQKKDMNFKSLDGEKIENMVFHIGLIELISYWKATCSPKVIIKCGYLDEFQKKWLKKLYFYGLR